MSEEQKTDETTAAAATSAATSAATPAVSTSASAAPPTVASPGSPAPGTEEYDQLCNWYLARLRTFSDPAFTPAALVNADKAKLEELVLAQIPADETKTSSFEVATVKAPVGWWKRFIEGLTSLFR